MLQTIEVEIDCDGRIHPLEAISFTPSGRAYLTLLPPSNAPSVSDDSQSCTASQALKLLASARFSNRPLADQSEVEQRIHELRNEWGD